jgi:hypothetical protein
MIASNVPPDDSSDRNAGAVWGFRQTGSEKAAGKDHLGAGTRENPIGGFMNLKERSIGQTSPGYVTAQPWPINLGIDGIDVCAKSGESAARQSRGMMP